MTVPEFISFDIGVKHLAYCELYDLNTYKFGLFDISSKKPLNRISNLYNVLNSIALPKTVIIEQQVIANSIAMSLQTAVEMFYFSKGLSMSNIIIYNPKAKFLYDNLKSFKGKEHKQISISYARNIIEKTQINILGDFERNKKKDDIADSICMAVFTFVNDKQNILSLIH